MADNNNNFYLSENEVLNLVSVLGAAAAGFKQQAKEHEHPDGIIAAWLKNYATAADEVREVITKQSNDNMKQALKG